MEISSFKYTKANGDVSKRDVLVLVKPSTFMEGVDMSELDEEAQAVFAAAVSAAHEEFRAKMAALMDEHDLKHTYRRFDPLKMTETKTEWI